MGDLRGDRGLSARAATTGAAYGEALDRIAHVVERRARNYRDLVVAIAIIGLGSVATALVMRSPRALAALLFLPPACAAAYWRDARLLDAWRADLLARWVTERFDLTAFGAAVRASPALPRATVDGMLATLPDAGELVAEQRIGAPTRNAVAATTEAFHHARTRNALLATVAGAATALAGLVAAVAGTWTPLLAIAPLVALAAVSTWLRRDPAAASTRTAIPGLAARRGEPEFDEAAYARLVVSIRA